MLHISSCNNINSKEYNKKLYQVIRAYGGFENWTVEVVEEYKNCISLQKTLDYSDVTIVCGSQKYPTHKCIIACRSEYLRDLLCKPPEKHIQ